MTDTDDRYEKILKAFEADTEFDVPKVDKKREASTEDWMDDGITLKELMRLRAEDEAGVVGKPYGADSLAKEEHDILTMSDLLKLQKEEEGGISQKFNGANENEEDPHIDYRLMKEIANLGIEEPHQEFQGYLGDDYEGNEYTEPEEIPTVEQQQAQKMREEIRNLASRLPEEYAYDSLANEGEFNCHICGFSTNDDDKMQYHMEDHDEGNRLVSDFMKYEMESKAEDDDQKYLDGLIEDWAMKDLDKESLASELTDIEKRKKRLAMQGDGSGMDGNSYGMDEPYRDLDEESLASELFDQTWSEELEHWVMNVFQPTDNYDLEYLKREGRNAGITDSDQAWKDFWDDWGVQDQMGMGYESEDKIEKTDVDDTEKVYDELKESYEESTMENQNQGFKSDSDEYGVADLNADREGKNMSKDFWSKTITTDDEATVLTEYNPQPNAKMGDYNVEVERELSAKDFPDSVTEVKKNDKFLASESESPSRSWWNGLPQADKENLGHLVSDIQNPQENELRNAHDFDNAMSQDPIFESKASEDFIHNYVDSSDIDVNDDGSLGDLDKQFEDEELPDEYYEMKNHDELNFGGDSKASEVDTLMSDDEYVSKYGSYPAHDIEAGLELGEIKSVQDLKDFLYNRGLHSQGIDNYVNQYSMAFESKATEDDFNHEFDELSSLAQQKIEDSDVTQQQWDETPTPQREQLEDAISSDEQYDSMGDVWQCPECGFKTGFEDEFNDHENSHVKAFTEDDISRPYDNLLDSFRS